MFGSGMECLVLEWNVWFWNGMFGSWNVPAYISVSHRSFLILVSSND